MTPDKPTVHVVGAGLAGLAAACALTAAGRHVTLFEAAQAAGGRARSYYDPVLAHRIDNGNHLFLSGNRAAMEFLTRIGSLDTLAGPENPVFPFIDLTSNTGWTLRLNRSRLPWWILVPSRRVPGTKISDYAALLKLRRAGPATLVAPLLEKSGALYTRFLEPLAISALNTMPDIAAAAPLRAVISETVERGGQNSIPRFARDGLSESFIDPALTWLRAQGATIHLGHRVTTLDAAQPTILAVPPWIAAGLVPGLTAPDEYESICNLHFRHDLPPGATGFWGFTGGMAEWAFARPGILSVTISAANRYSAIAPADIAAQVWSELSRSFSLPSEIPLHRVIWEKRATFIATPAQLARRPGARTASKNLFLAGDWTNTGLPATIEGAIRSGNTAAAALLRA
jgi:squalene-associated FAD-dependent desaturase